MNLQLCLNSDFKDWDPLLMVALVRCTFIWRKNIPNWCDTLKRIDIELTNRNLDTKQILQGLYREDGKEN